ncbi:MAG: hypothetical protein H6733_05810 [Alphaproteobacteria bacterium]|nr:hypothetical protein [Alphaproteobacteria bacterium]
MRHLRSVFVLAITLPVWPAAAAEGPAPAAAEAAPGETADWKVLADTSSWEKVATRDTDVGQVEVRHRKLGELHCLQGLVTTNVSPQALLDVAQDVKSAKRWTSAPLTESVQLKAGPGWIEYEQYLDIPDWTMVTDRYWVLRGEPVVVDDGGRRFRWTRVSAQAAYPQLYERLSASGLALEVPVNWGEWFFTPGTGGTDVRYSVCTDVGGSIPAWLQKMAAQRTLPDTVADLVKEAQRRALPATQAP